MHEEMSEGVLLRAHGLALSFPLPKLMSPWRQWLSSLGSYTITCAISLLSENHHLPSVLPLLGQAPALASQEAPGASSRQEEMRRGQAHMAVACPLLRNFLEVSPDSGTDTSLVTPHCERLGRVVF